MLVILVVLFDHFRYEIMLECWQEHPNDRPTFSQLRSKFSTLLLANVDDPYMILEVDDAKPYYQVAEEETSEQRESVSSNDSDSSLKKKGPPKKPVWAKPSNPYVDTPAVVKEVSITVEEDTPQGMAEDEPSTPPQGGGAGGEQQGRGGLGVPESTVDGFDPYIRMKSSPVEVTSETQQSLPPVDGDMSNQQPVSMSLPAEHSRGFSLSVLSEEKVAHQPVKRIRSNPYVDDPGRRQILEESNGVENKIPSISENGTGYTPLVNEP